MVKEMRLKFAKPYPYSLLVAAYNPALSIALVNVGSPELPLWSVVSARGTKKRGRRDLFTLRQVEGTLLSPVYWALPDGRAWETPEEAFHAVTSERYLNDLARAEWEKLETIRVSYAP